MNHAKNRNNSELLFPMRVAWASKGFDLDELRDGAAGLFLDRFLQSGLKRARRCWNSGDLGRGRHLDWVLGCCCFDWSLVDLRGWKKNL